MANVVISPNMNLPIPVVGVDSGPDYAQQVNNSLTIVDQHNHAAGYGIQITPAGMNISTDLPFNSNNATLLRSVRFSPNTLNISGGADLRCLYVVGVDIWYNDGNGNQIQFTNQGAIAGTPGSIANLSSPASASYVSANSTVVFQSGANLAASLDCGNVVLRNIGVSSSPGLTLTAPTLSSNITITLPPIPPGQQIMTLDNAGNMSAPYTVDNTTTAIVNSQIVVYNSAIVPIGSILAFGGTSIPVGYLLCNGTSYSASTYGNLYTVIGTNYGGGGGYFNVPDLRGMFLRGVDQGTGRDPDSNSRYQLNAGGNSGDAVGSWQPSQYYSHSHTDTGHIHSYIYQYGRNGGGGADGGSGNGTLFAGNGTAGNTTSSGNANIANSGGNETRSINVYVYYIIKY